MSRIATGMTFSLKVVTGQDRPRHQKTDPVDETNPLAEDAVDAAPGVFEQKIHLE